MTTQKFPSPAERNVGTWLSIGNPLIAELAGAVGLDWVLIDLEHGNGSLSDVPDQLRAVMGTATRPVVRVGAAQPDLMARLLDWGAGGLMVPHVNSADEARACVRAMRYPPRGSRGVSRSVRAYRFGLDEFPSAADPEPLLIAQIETLEAVQAAAEIAAVDGVDVLFVGPADLQYDLRTRSAPAGVEYAACLQQVAAAARAAEKPCGILVRNPDDLPQLLKQGFRWIAMDSDVGLLRAGFQRIVQTAMASESSAGAD